MSRWGDTSSDEEHNHHRGSNPHNDEENQEATPETVEAVSRLLDLDCSATMHVRLFTSTVCLTLLLCC